MEYEDYSQRNEELRNFFQHVITRENLKGWSLHIVDNSSEGYCWGDKKQIDVGVRNQIPKRLMLHEIAHINTAVDSGNKHNKPFWDRFEQLMIRYLPNAELQKRY